MPLSVLDWSDLRPDDGRSCCFTPSSRRRVKSWPHFLGAGGRVAVLDDFGAGDEILERFHIERVAAPSRPLATSAITRIWPSPNRCTSQSQDTVPACTPAVEDVERLMTNHPTGLSNPKLTPVLKIRAIDGPDVVIALAGNYGDDKS